MSVRTILDRKGHTVETTSERTNARTAAVKMVGYGIAALVVVDSNDTVTGIISERDIMGAVARGEDLMLARVGDLMRKDVVTIAPEERVTRAMALMTQHRTRHLPVVDGRRLVGIVSIGDAVKYRLDDLQTETSVLRDIYVAGR